MGNIFNDDFSGFIGALNNNEVEYLLVGGYAVIMHAIEEQPVILMYGSTQLIKTKISY